MGKAKVRQRRQQSQADNTANNEARVDPEATSLNEEGAGASEDLSNMLSEELRAELGGNDNELMIMPGNHKSKKTKEKKKDEHVKAKEEDLQVATKMSKAKRKKLEAIAAKKEKEAKREQLFKSLTERQLSEEQQNLMQSSARLGHKSTLKERLKQSMNRHKAGIQLSEQETAELFVEKDVANDESNDSEEKNVPSEDTPAPKKKNKGKKRKQSASQVVDTADTESKEPLNDAKAEAPTSKTEEENKKATAGANKKKKRKKAAPVVTYRTIAASDVEDSAEDGCDNVSKPEEPQEDADAKQKNSQSDAMAKLAALRAKNEARRREKEQASTSTKDKVSSESEQVSNEPMYVPEPIVLKTEKEMAELSKQTSLPIQRQLVHVERNPDIQMARMKLPVCSSEQEIMEAIADNDVVLLCGETGSGKTTQVPQFLFEAGYGHPEHGVHSGKVGVTQPRRVAAVSTAKRVAEELNVGFGGGEDALVGYQIRYDATHVGPNTRVKFMTDGILLKEIQQDFLLRSYSIILLDEAHERNVNTDILIGLLSRIAPMRAQMAKEEKESWHTWSDEEKKERKPIEPLKLVIMSATLRVEDFTQNARLFPTPPPVLKVEARQYPVTVHFNKRTELDDYVNEAYKKVCKIHKRLPEGGILVFLTGQREIKQLCKKLRGAFAPKTTTTKAVKEEVRQRRNVDEEELALEEHDDMEDEADLNDIETYGKEEEDNEPMSEEEDEDEEMDELAVPYLYPLPLYSLLANDEQMRVFEPPPEDHRLVVVATNVAETSLTIPGIKYVVDAGRTKERVYDLSTGISTFDVQWISKASADQRAGRAGRTGPGHCYRLYSSAVFNEEFAKFSPPEILGRPIEDLVLQMKTMGIHDVPSFPFPTPPDRDAIQKALQTLEYLGAVQNESVTALGSTMVRFPVSARFSKMLLLAKELNALEYTIAMVAAMSGHSPFIMDGVENEEDKKRHAQWKHPDSDILSLLRATGAYAFSGGSKEFCEENFLHEKTMQQALKLRQQLTRIVNQVYYNRENRVKVNPRMSPPDVETEKLLRQIVTAGFLDQVAKHVPPGTITEGSRIERTCAYLTATQETKTPAYVHPHSSVFSPNARKLPELVVYTGIERTTKVYLKAVTVIDSSWLASIGQNTPLCKLSEPLDEPRPFYDKEADEVKAYVRVYYGVSRWELPITCVKFPATSKLDKKYRWVAKLLLDGEICDQWSGLPELLSEPSANLIRRKFDSKIQLLVSKLMRTEVDSKSKLIAQWKQNKMFLKDEISKWIRPDSMKAFESLWKRAIDTKRG